MNEYVLEGEYLEIIIELLSEDYKVNSFIKLVFMAFCVKNEKKNSYGNRKKDFVDAFMDNINVKLLSHPEEMKAIFEVINKLKSSGWISVDRDVITVERSFESMEYNNPFLKGCKDKQFNPIREVNKLDSRAFAEEVLRHV